MRVDSSESHVKTSAAEIDGFENPKNSHRCPLSNPFPDFCRRDGLLDVFGEKFPMPAEAVYEYVTVTVDVAEERMRLRVCGETIDEMAYRLR